jgi:hypothetical protein
MYCTCIRFVVAVKFVLDKRYSFLIYMKIVYISATGELYATYYVTSGTTNYVILLNGDSTTSTRFTCLVSTLLVLLLLSMMMVSTSLVLLFGLLVPECFIHPVVSVSALPWFNRYIYIYNNYRTSDVLTIFIDNNNRTRDVLTIFIDSNNRTSDVLTIFIDCNNRTSDVLTKHVNLVLVVESPLSNMT